jgi:hypothetical protein
MQKASLYEAILLVNRGVDEAVHGLERLIRLKSLSFDPNYLKERLLLFEKQRARLNHFFCANMESREEGDALRFEERYRHFQKGTLDEMQVYRDVLAVEERRCIAGDPPRVRFFTREELQVWERQYPKPAQQAETQSGNSVEKQP